MLMCLETSPVRQRGSTSNFKPPAAIHMHANTDFLIDARIARALWLCHENRDIYLNSPNPI